MDVVNFGRRIASGISNAIYPIHIAGVRRTSNQCDDLIIIEFPSIFVATTTTKTGRYMLTKSVYT